jgi:hypothetical protein
MAHTTGSRHFHRKNTVSYERKAIVPSLVVHINQSGIVTTPNNGSTYRTEVYLQQRENKLPVGTKTTWKNLMQQKRIVDHDQAEIDRVLSTIDSIHGTFNRSLLIPYNQAYSSLYGDDDQSARLMKTFCQRQDHYIKDEEKNHTQETSSSFGNFQNTDSDSINSEDDDEDEKKKSYDSGYGSVMPKRRLSRELPIDISSNPHQTTN